MVPDAAHLLNIEQDVVFDAALMSLLDRHRAWSREEPMSKETFDQGLAIRKEVLGAEHVERSLASADDFSRPYQELITEYCWGAVWGRPGLSRKTRSLLNLAMLTALNREEEFKLHVRAAFRNGVTRKRSARSCSRARSIAAYPPPTRPQAREVFAQMARRRRWLTTCSGS